MREKGVIFNWARPQQGTRTQTGGVDLIPNQDLKKDRRVHSLPRKEHPVRRTASFYLLGQLHHPPEAFAEFDWRESRSFELLRHRWWVR